MKDVFVFVLFCVILAGPLLFVAFMGEAAIYKESTHCEESGGVYVKLAVRGHACVKGGA